MQRGLIIYSRLSLLFYGRDLPTVFFDIIGYKFEFSLALVLFPLPELGENELESIFNSILSAAFQYFYKFAPLLLTVIFDDIR
jgi:hypothetical protein